MEKEQYKIITEWIESTQSAIETLQAWLHYLRAWRRHGMGRCDSNLDEAFGWLRDEGLDGWADRNPCDIDLLLAVAVGKELPEPPRDILEVIFGKGTRQ